MIVYNWFKEKLLVINISYGDDNNVIRFINNIKENKKILNPVIDIEKNG